MSGQPAKSWVKSSLPGMIGVALLTTASQGLHAQDAEDTPAPFAEGVIIYSRDVHHTVGAPFFPGQTHSVVTGPTNAIVAGVDNGLKPLSDDDIAFVSASNTTPANFVEQPLNAGFENLTGNSGAAISTTGQEASIAGGAIGGAMESLSSALGTMSAILGGTP